MQSLEATPYVGHRVSVTLDIRRWVERRGIRPLTKPRNLPFAQVPRCRGVEFATTARHDPEHQHQRPEKFMRARASTACANETSVRPKLPRSTGVNRGVSPHVRSCRSRKDERANRALPVRSFAPVAESGTANDRWLPLSSMSSRARPRSMSSESDRPQRRIAPQIRPLPQIPPLGTDSHFSSSRRLIYLHVRWLALASRVCRFAVDFVVGWDKGRC
jgi:hypothetical protein